MTKFPAIAIILLLLSLNASAQHCIPDAYFGNNGCVKTSFDTSDYGVDVRIAKNGKIIALAQQYSAVKSMSVLARYLPDGSLDATFGNGGRANPDSTLNTAPTRLFLQDDGKILIAGYIYNNATKSDFWLMRCLPDGSRDLSFGQNGSVMTDFMTTYDTPFDIQVQPDGKILVSGLSLDINTSWTSDWAIARYLPNGQPDPSFGQGGKLRINVSTGDEGSTSVALKSDGKILIGGYSTNSADSRDMVILQLNAGGQPDSSFGSNDFVWIDVTDDDRIRRLIVDSLDRIMALGESQDPRPDTYINLFRLKPDGTIDHSFGGGLQSLALQERSLNVRDMAIDQMGGVVMLLNTADDYYEHFLLRVDSTGTVDNDFGFNGRSAMNNQDTVFGSVLAIQPDNKIVVMGTANTITHTGRGSQVAMIRYTYDNGLSIGNAHPGTTAFLYPNPAHDKIFLKANALKGEELILTDMTGKMALTGQASIIKNDGLDISRLSPGMYMAQYLTPSGRQTQLIQVMH